MNDQISPDTLDVLNDILKYELSGVIRYTHYALMIVGRDRLTLKKFFEEQANESLSHAQQAGDIMTGLGGHPSLEISIIDETNQHAAIKLLKESAEHEKAAIVLYNNGQSLKQISELLNSYDLDEIKNLFLSDEDQFSKEVKPKIISEKYSQNKLATDLKKLGREEGRVLRSQWLKFAITKWCVFEVKKKELSKLTDEEVDILAQAFKSSLMQTKALKNLDNSIL